MANRRDIRMHHHGHFGLIMPCSLEEKWERYNQNDEHPPHQMMLAVPSLPVSQIAKETSQKHVWVQSDFFLVSRAEFSRLRVRMKNENGDLASNMEDILSMGRKVLTPFPSWERNVVKVTLSKRFSRKAV
jgi:hypothetical protein